jgi:hypothetical protein
MSLVPHSLRCCKDRLGKSSAVGLAFPYDELRGLTSLAADDGRRDNGPPRLKRCR